MSSFFFYYFFMKMYRVVSRIGYGFKGYGQIYYSVVVFFLGETLS